MVPRLLDLKTQGWTAKVSGLQDIETETRSMVPRLLDLKTQGWTAEVSGLQDIRTETRSMVPRLLYLKTQGWTAEVSGLQDIRTETGSRVPRPLELKIPGWTAKVSGLQDIKTETGSMTPGLTERNLMIPELRLRPGGQEGLHPKTGIGTDLSQPEMDLKTKTTNLELKKTGMIDEYQGWDINSGVKVVRRLG